MNVRDVLLHGPELVRSVELDLWAHKEKREAALLRMRVREADVALMVAQAKDESGKKRFSNEAERDGEVRRILASDEAFNDARREADEEKAICARVEAALEYQRNRQRNARALALSSPTLDLVFDGGEP